MQVDICILANKMTEHSDISACMTPNGPHKRSQIVLTEIIFVQGILFYRDNHIG